MTNEKFQKLWETSLLLYKYYDIDKVKPWAIYVYDKNDSKNSNVGLFDIYKNEIVFYTDNHTIVEDARKIIEEIQKQLEE